MVNLKFCLFLAFALQVKAEESRIIGGKPALQSSYPFVVSFQNFTEDEFLWMKSPRYQHFCAGTILDATRILTAGKLIKHKLITYSIFDMAAFLFPLIAHCIKDISDYRNVSIYAGVTNLQDTNGQRRFIKGCVPYSEYKSGKDFGNNDVAVCRLSSRLVQDNPTNLQANNGSRVTFVTLDDSNAAVQKPGTMCRVVGWGSVSMISLGSLTFVNDLQAINLPILEHSKCAAMWPK